MPFSKPTQDALDKLAADRQKLGEKNVAKAAATAAEATAQKALQLATDEVVLATTTALESAHDAIAKLTKETT